MLEEQDIKRIGEELGLVIEHNLMPQFDRLDDRLDRIETRLDKLEDKVETLPTKDFVQDKLDDLHVETVNGFKAIERRMDRMIDDAPKSELERLRLYPRPNEAAT